MKIVAVVPANYMPHMHYFQMMYVVDEMYIDDDAHYIRNSWQDGNRIRWQAGVKWLRVPTVRPDLDYPKQRLSETRIDYSRDWNGMHANLIKEAYHGSQFFELYYKDLEDLLLNTRLKLIDLDVDLVELFFKKHLELETPVLRTSSVNYERENPDPNVRLKKFLQAVGATTLVEFEGGKTWLDEGVLKGAGVELRWFHPETEVYIQNHPGFDWRVCALDALFSLGPMATGQARKVEWHDAEVLEDHMDGDLFG